MYVDLIIREADVGERIPWRGDSPAPGPIDAATFPRLRSPSLKTPF